MTFLAVAVGGSLGAACRLLLDSFIRKRNNSAFPWGIFVVNVSGSFAIGVVAGLGMTWDLPELPLTAVSTGFLGAYTTFSGWMLQTLELMESGVWDKAVYNILGSTLAGIISTVAGIAIILAIT